MLHVRCLKKVFLLLKDLFYKQKNYGNSSGSAWNDITHFCNPMIVGIRAIELFHDSHVHSIQVTYLLADGTMYAAPRHGNNNGSRARITLSQKEQIVRVDGSADGIVINHLTFFSKNSREKAYGPYGIATQQEFNVEG